MSGYGTSDTGYPVSGQAGGRAAQGPYGADSPENKYVPELLAFQKLRAVFASSPLLCRREGAAFSDALAVSGTVRADGHAVLHLHPQVLPDKVHGGLDGQPGVPFAAPGATHLADAVQGGRSSDCSVPRAPGPGVDAVAMARNCPALIPPRRPPEAAGPPGTLAPAVHLPESASPGPADPGVPVGGEQRRSHHHMVLWPVHMAEGQVHHPAEDSDGVGGGLRRHRPKMVSMPWVWQSLQT